MSTKSKVKAGFLTLFGLPNAGKSSLLNALVGEAIAIVTPKAQTTWQVLRGYVVRPDLELVVTDTPGIQEGTKALNLALAQNAARALKVASKGKEYSDLVCFVVDTAELGARIRDQKPLGLEAIRNILHQEFGKQPFKLPVIPVLTKADLIRKDEYRKQIEEVLNEFVSELFTNFKPAIWVSVKKGQGISELLERVKSLLSEEESGTLFELEALSDQSLRAMASEFIREQCFLQLGAELPYSIAVEIVTFVEPKGERSRENDPKLYRIEALLHVERESQKHMVIGKGGSKIKAIGTKARERLEAFLGRKVYLGLKVKVTPHWSREPELIERFGYG